MSIQRRLFFLQLISIFISRLFGEQELCVMFPIHYEINRISLYFLYFLVIRIRLAWTGDGHEEQPFVTDKKENDLSGYERNLYLYHVSKT